MLAKAFTFLAGLAGDKLRLGLVIAAALMALCLWWLWGKNEALGREIGEVTAANQAQNLALEAERAENSGKDKLLLEYAQKADRAASQSRALDNQLKKAVKNAKIAGSDSVLDDAVTDAFCLRWHSASGRISGGVQNGAAGRAAAGAPDTATALCGSWRGKVTVADVFEWTGELLDHAGLERLDKAGLREWAGEQSEDTDMGKQK